jgi:uncharacterized membrane protein HdeD (DUF308 family)
MSNTAATAPRLSTWLAIRGVIAILFGLLALFWPSVTILALALLFGAYALVDGVGMVFDAFRGERTGGQRAAYLIGGLLGVAAGAVTLFWPGITALVLVILVGVWAVVTGILDIVAATQLRGAWLLILVGVLSLLAGVLILFRPDAGAIVIAQVIGIYAIISGVLMLMELYRIRRARSTTNRAAAAGA